MAVPSATSPVVSLREIADKYDVFILDQYGVVRAHVAAFTPSMPPNSPTHTFINSRTWLP